MFFPLGEKHGFESSYIDTVGRALCIAQNFESNCRSLAVMLDLKNFHRNSIQDVEFGELIEKLSNRMLAKSIERMGKYVPIPDAIGDILEAGKNARNYIAHDSMKTLFDTNNVDECLSRDLVTLRDEVQKLAVADGMVAAWSSGISEGLTVSSSGYAKKVENWVFNEFAPEDFEPMG